MKQLTQRLKDGAMSVRDVPEPELDEWRVLVATEASLISAGTERAKVDVARESLIGKARRRPDEVRKVLDKARTEGIAATIGAVRARLDELSPLGYCAAGRAVRVGSRVRDILPGTLVACGGEDAAHAEVIAVPGSLCVPVPEGIAPAAAAFTTLGAIALHGLRQADVTVGTRVAIVGMGLIGQLTGRIAKAAGCEVLGVDLEEWRLRAAAEAGVADLAVVRGDLAAAGESSWDAVIVTAAAPGNNDPVSAATDLARDRGRIVVVGDVRLDLDRRRLYEKELELRLARSYGPGRYDTDYEERGLDYPLPYVRWTERRNMVEFLRLVAEGTVAVDDLITHRYPIEEAMRAFDALRSPHERAFAVVIDYNGAAPASGEPLPSIERRGRRDPSDAVAFIGAGSFARRHLIPLARHHGLRLDRVATASGLSAASAAEQFGFSRGAVTVGEIFEDESIGGVVIATRHDRHAPLAVDALHRGLAVFVEKPLCLNQAELRELRAELEAPGAPPLMVGFNRRFAAMTEALRNHLAGAHGPTNIVLRVNAGPLPPNHWLNDPHEGGGRLLGEGCHFFDLACQIAGSDPVAVVAQARLETGSSLQVAQDFAASIRFADGSIASLVYGTLGSGRMGKELVEAHRGARSARLDDFKTLQLWGDGSRTIRARSRDKGHSAQVERFADVMRGHADAPPVGGYVASTALTLAAQESLSRGEEVLVEDVLARTSPIVARDG
jgi:predicted dehydrogenase/threonine dehydrogenase-like Zn-dependent dehydrogenase